jgi:hypothetical protein
MYMKTKKKLSVLVGLILVFVMTSTIGVFAQNDNANTNKKPKKSPEERTNIIVPKMTSKLLLGADQVPKVHDIILEREKQKDLDFAAFQNDKEKMKQARIARNKKADDALKTVLNDKQFKELLKWRKEANQNKKNKNNKPDVGIAPDVSADDIDGSDN